MTGYYGYGKMADNASNLRFQGQGMYSKPAELQAAKSVYGERWFGDVGAMAQNIEGLRTNKTDPAGLVKLERLVGKIDVATSNMDVLARLPEAIQKNVEQYKKDTGDTGLALTGYGSLAPYGLDFLSPDVIRRASTMSSEETSGLYGQYKSTIKEFEPMLGDNALMEYQNTKMQMEIAGLRIENAFLDALKELNPEIQDLSKYASGLIKEFIRSDVIAKAIDSLKTGLHEFDDWLGDTKRKDTLAAVMYDLDVFGGMVYSAASGLGSLAKMLGFVGEKTLKASEYHELLGIRAISPDLADKMKESLENPNDTSSRNDAISAFNGLTEPQKKQITDKYGKQFNEIFAGIIKPDDSMSIKRLVDDWTIGRDKASMVIGDTADISKRLADDWTTGRDKASMLIGDGVDLSKEQISDTKNYLKGNGFLKNSTSEQTKMKGMTMKALIDAGFTPNQAKAVFGEVGRENDFNENTIFGYHGDATGVTNVGMFSWNQDRGERLKKELTEKGLMTNGKMTHSQEAITAQAKFFYDEMKNGSLAGTQFINNPDLPYNEQRELLGKTIGWAIHQTSVRDGHGGRKPFNSPLHERKRDNYHDEASAFLPQKDLDAVDLKQQHEESAKTWRPVVYTRGENGVKMTQGEPQIIAPRKQTSINAKVIIENRSGTDLTSQSVGAGL